MTVRVGVLGGTFDPVHFGHLRIAEEAADELRLDTVLFVPAAVPPHKASSEILTFDHRWQMLMLAIEGNPRFSLSDVENRTDGKSYTVSTLKKLSREFTEDADLFFLVGLDAFLELDTWWNYLELFELASIAVLTRPGFSVDRLEEFLSGSVSRLYALDQSRSRFEHPSLLPVYSVRNTRMDISSTRIRQQVAQNSSIRYLVPTKVMSYITRNDLYRAGH